jgi:diguanylate cyclase (GGDEF)-like protein/PAS domain S-box-containing protein
MKSVRVRVKNIETTSALVRKCGQKLRPSEERLRELSGHRQTAEDLHKLLLAVEQSDSTIVITDLKGTIEFANPAFERITGYTCAEAIGQSSNIVKSGQTPPEVYAKLWQTITQGEVWRGELLNKKKNGEFYWEKASISPVRNPFGQITHYVAVKEDVTEIKQAEQELRRYVAEIERLQEKLREQAIRDPLTGAFNRRYLIETLDRELAHASRHGSPISLVMIDADHFKNINDTFGHQAGDLALQRLVQLIERHTRKSDVVCRYGGEEFVVLLPETAPEDAYRRAEEWRLAFAAERIEFNGQTFQVTISLGVAAGSVPEVSGASLLNAADQAMYRAKEIGRNRTVLSEIE